MIDPHPETAFITQAECAKEGIDPNLFFDANRVQEAINICMDCPVMIQCAEYAIKNGMTSGVWGGLSEQQRAKLRNRLASRKGIPNRKH